MKRSSCFSRLVIAPVGILMMLFMAGCSSSGGGSDSGTTVAQTPAKIAIGVSSAQVKSDNSESIAVNVSVLDAENVAIADATVTFSASGGSLSSGSAETNEEGLATVNFSAGLNDKTNRLVTITASVTGLNSVQVPVQITGSTVSLLSLDTVALEAAETSTDRLQISLKDAGGQPIFNAPVELSISSKSTGNVTLSTTSDATDVNGELVVVVTGVTPGSAIVDVEAGGATATVTYLVQATGAVFGIVSPEQTPLSASTAQSVVVIVESPTPGSSNTVVFATTLGSFAGGGAVGNVINVPVVDGKAQATLTSSEAGVATVQVSDFNNTNVSDSVSVAFFAPASQASKITLQASNSVVATSTVDIKNSVTLYASVVNMSDQVVGGAPVLFTLSNTTGGGEYITPAITYTDATGVATSIFTSGSLSSDALGVNVTASVMGAVGVSPSTIPIIIGGKAGSVGIGTATTISSVDADTAYQLALSVIVSDANGNPVPGAEVSLKLWPVGYRQALSVVDGDTCTNRFFNNEDQNRNLRLDPGEDLNGDGQITPAPAVAGTIPSTVTVDEFGVGTFYIKYLKDYATYVDVELTATTIVGGSEFSSKLIWWLEYLESDEEHLGSSPFNDAAYYRYVDENCSEEEEEEEDAGGE